MPLVKPVAIDDVPTVSVSLWSRDVDDSTLRILANDVLQELGQVKNTGKGFVVGGRADQIRVEVMPEKEKVNYIADKALWAAAMAFHWAMFIVVLLTFEAL